MLASETKRCPRCTETKPMTDEHWYFHKSGPKEGLVTGWCRVCQRAYNRANTWERTLSGLKLARRCAQKREYNRRRSGVRPERWRESWYDRVLAAATGAPATCPDCGSVRLEEARTRTGRVMICWRCSWRLSLGVAS